MKPMFSMLYIMYILFFEIWLTFFLSFFLFFRHARILAHLLFLTTQPLSLYSTIVVPFVIATIHFKETIVVPFVTIVVHFKEIIIVPFITVVAHFNSCCPLCYSCYSFQSDI